MTTKVLRRCDMHAEIKPVLFETLIWSDSKESRLQQSLDSSDALEFRYTRYVSS